MSGGIGDNSGSGQLRAFVERIERLEEEIKAINDDKSEVYKEAKATGFNVKVLRKVIAARRQDYAERQEIDTLFDMYMTALGEAPESPVRARVENIEEFPNPRPTSLPEADKGEALTSSPAASPALSSAVSVGGVDEVASESRNNLEEGAKPAPSLPDDFEPPAFLAKKYVLRPHCLHPELCAGSGSNHCHECRKAMSGDEVSA